MINKINLLSHEFLESKKTKKDKYRADFAYSKYNDTLKTIFKIDDESLFEKIILAKKKEIEAYIVIYKKYLFDNGFEHQSIDSLIKKHPKNTVFQKLLKLHNYYDSFSTDWNKKIVKSLNIKACLYCNRESVLYYKDGTTAEIDHFYPRGLYPFLSISFHNLIPSCKTCNSKFKGARDTHIEKILYPYEENLNDNIHFKYDGIKSKEDLKQENLDFFHEDRVAFSIESIDNKNVTKEHIELFKLQTLYDEHKDTISELLAKRVLYSDDYIDSLMQQYEGTLFKNREDLLRLITCGYINDEDINKRPLSKLIKDISEELKLI